MRSLERVGEALERELVSFGVGKHALDDDAPEQPGGLCLGVFRSPLVARSLSLGFAG
jgi:hypothetical protein